jgi:hypothetical protein
MDLTTVLELQGLEVEVDEIAEVPQSAASWHC